MYRRPGDEIVSKLDQPKSNRYRIVGWRARTLRPTAATSARACDTLVTAHAGDVILRGFCAHAFVSMPFQQPAPVVGGDGGTWVDSTAETLWNHATGKAGTIVAGGLRATRFVETGDSMISVRDVFGICFLTFLVGSSACDGEGKSSQTPPVPETTASLELTTRGTAADEQARATVYADRAAAYGRLADDNRQAAAALAAVIAKDAAGATQATAAPAVAAGAVDSATIAPAVVRDKRQAAADLADRLKAAAQKAADFHTQRATDLAAAANAGVAK